MSDEVVNGYKGIAKVLGCTDESAKWHVRQGRIPVTHLGRKVITTRSAVMAVATPRTDERRAECKTPRG
jgi:hypothetical protein